MYKVDNVDIFVQLQIENKLVIVTSWIYFDANLYSTYYQNISDEQNFASTFILKFRQ